MAEVKVIRTDAKRNAEITEMTARIIAASSHRYTVFFYDGTKHHNIAQLPPPHTPFKLSQDDWLHIHRGLKMIIEMVDKEGMSSNVVFDIHADKWVEIYSTNTPMFELTGCFKFDFVDTPLDMKTMTFDVVANTAKQLNSKGKWCQPEIHNGNEQECACRSTPIPPQQ